MPLCQGIAALTGLDVLTVEGATGELDTNYEGKVAAALKILKTHDFAAIHIEAPDECTHNGDLKGKITAIEWLDSRVLSPLVKKLASCDFSYRLLVLSDHKTLTSTRGHDGDPVLFSCTTVGKTVIPGILIVRRTAIRVCLLTMVQN